MKENHLFRWLVMFLLICTVFSSDADLQLEIDPKLQAAAKEIGKQVVNVEWVNCLYDCLLEAWELIDEDPKFEDEQAVRNHIYNEFETNKDKYRYEYNMNSDKIYNIPTSGTPAGNTAMNGFAQSLKIPIARYTWKNDQLRLNQIILENGSLGLRRSEDGSYFMYTEQAKKFDPIENFDRAILLVYVNNDHFMYLKPLNEKKKIEKIKEEKDFVKIEEKKKNLGIAASKTSSSCKYFTIVLCIIFIVIVAVILFSENDEENLNTSADIEKGPSPDLGNSESIEQAIENMNVVHKENKFDQIAGTHETIDVDGLFNVNTTVEECDFIE